MIELQCKCGKKLKVPGEAAGKKGKCPGCGALFTIPAPGAPAMAQARGPTPQQHAASQRAAPQRSVPQGPVPQGPIPQRAGQDDFFSDLPPVQTGPAPGTPAAIPGYNALMPQGFDHVPAAQENPYASPPAPTAPARGPQGPGMPMPAAGGKARCYNCGSPEHKKVHWTIWGGIIGPMMLSHVRCVSCGTTYNSKTGKSNNTAITIYVVVGLVIGGAVGLLGALASIMN